MLLLRCCRLLASVRLHNGQYVLINTIVSAWENTSNHEPELRASNLFQPEVIEIWRISQHLKNSGNEKLLLQNINQ